MTYTNVETSNPNGVWSFVDLKRGDRLVVFCDNSEKGLAALLADNPPRCKADASPATQKDVELAAAIESGPLTPARAIELAKAGGSTIGYQLPSYLCARFNNDWMTDDKDFELLLSLMELPTLGYVARSTFIHDIEGMLMSARTCG